jgi:nucleotide-binding universal stress UspA family protein
MKTILCHVQDDETLEQRIENALAIARAAEGHVTFLHVTPAEAYVAFDAMGGLFVMDDVMKSLSEQEQRARERVEQQLGSQNVSWEYRQSNGPLAGEIVSHAAFADLIVTAREPGGKRATPSLGMFGDVLAHSRTPLFIAGDTVCDPGAPAVIAWNGSFEAAHAVRASLGLLKLASRVHVLTIEEKGGDGAFPGTGLLDYLSRHGLRADLVTVPLERDFICAQLIAEAQRLDAGYLLTGSYGHSRIGEYIFGGVTRDLLSSSPVALVTLH